MFSTIPINDNLSFLILYDTEPIIAPIGHRMFGISIGKP